ncbi:PREDICTED: Hermansky-Pudlak syndrome 5 protein [Cyprinodon variegatus]|uniref:Hermansky-Pudlak syndrome 5 protein n=1 Tax=Cyprinodon variegatus TaxID=28743 RepID=UPI0007428C49|nr:PREDICTED: Hermansky-Pudlak syndrome 5 protein [Cyprinodon variegatus]
MSPCQQYMLVLLLSDCAAVGAAVTMPLVVPENHSHVLAEFDCLDPLLSALRLDSGRLKCTCLAVSRKWLALGTSTGGLHLIQKEGWKQRLILTHKEGSITQVACCPHDEDFIAVATSQGLVVVWELQLERRGRPERVSVSSEHRGHDITALCWDTNALRVFVGDSAGKVSCLRAGSSKLGKGAAFVIFPVQTVTTVDSRVVQLGYYEGRLLVSSLSRCYLCDTEKEKFWRVGNKERDGEYGACFFPLSRGLLVGQPPLLYCARPGSRIWEANFNGEVLSTHQFKQLLACPPLPLITYRNEPNYNPTHKSAQSLCFPKLLYFGDQNLLTWTDSAIFIFTPQNGQVLLWTEVKDLADVAVHRNELFCLHGSGRLSHLSLLSAERCVERLLRKESWTLAATVCCMFQHAIMTSRARKCVPMDRLEQLKSQLSSSSQAELIHQLEEVILKLEPLDSACSSRRSSISSHVRTNISFPSSYSIHLCFSSHSCPHLRLDPQSGERPDADRPDQGLQFHLPLSFRSKPPRMALQAVKDSVSSFVKKTTEKINTLQMNSELRQRPEFKESSQPDALAGAPSYSEEMENDVYNEVSNAEVAMEELRAATERAVSQIHDPLAVLDPVCLRETLMEWLPVLERTLGPANLSASVTNSSLDGSEEQWERDYLSPCTDQQQPTESLTVEAKAVELEEKEVVCEKPQMLNISSLDDQTEPVRVAPPTPLPTDLEANLSELATLHMELSCFRNQQEVLGGSTFLRRYFFLLDTERVRRMCLLCYRQQPKMMSSFSEAMLELTQSSKVVEVIQKGDLLKSLRSLKDLQPCAASHLLAHFHRLYEKHGEAAVRSFAQFYPVITPADVAAVAQQSHFLAYLDNLVQSRPEEHRLSFLQSLLEPESLRHDWLELALTHDAPQLTDTLTSDGRPRWHSHRFTWGYRRLLSLLIRLPADISSKEKMTEMCRSHGYWTGYLYLCKELQSRTEAFSTICQLDDVSLLEDPDGVEPETLDEWKLLLQLSQQYCGVAAAPPAADVNGSGWSNGSTDCQGRITPESLTLMLARTVGPDRALALLQECGVQVVLSPHSKLVCDLLRVTEKRQRAMIQTMLERCDRFLWSQHA